MFTIPFYVFIVNIVSSSLLINRLTNSKRILNVCRHHTQKHCWHWSNVLRNRDISYADCVLPVFFYFRVVFVLMSRLSTLSCKWGNAILHDIEIRKEKCLVREADKKLLHDAVQTSGIWYSEIMMCCDKLIVINFILLMITTRHSFSSSSSCKQAIKK